MVAWPDRSIPDLFGIEAPVLLAPMAGPGTPELAIVVSEAGGLRSLPCAQLSVEQARSALNLIREGTSRPINVNFFCHTPPSPDPERKSDVARKACTLYRNHINIAHPRTENEQRVCATFIWFLYYFVEQGLDPEMTVVASKRRAFDSEYCALVEEHKPEVVSFHFGLPEERLVSRVKATGARVIALATTVSEARWLEEHGCDAVIAMGLGKWEGTAVISSPRTSHARSEPVRSYRRLQMP